MPKPKQRQERQLSPVLHIFCEGAKTEPLYITAYIQKHFPGTKLIKIEPTKKTTPKQLVKEALGCKKCAPEGDVVWVVYDREGPTKYPDALHADARQNAGDKVHIALSNVCFEVWLLLHFQSTCAPHDSCDDLLSRSRLKEHIPNYDKADRREYSDTEIAAARQHAERLNACTQRGADASWTQPHQWNPFTDVHKLLDAIDEFGEMNCSRKP